MTAANIASALYASAARQPEATALIMAQKPDRHGRLSYISYSFAELVAESERLAGGLLRSGLTRGMRTVLMVPPSLEFFALMYAMLKTGIVPVLIDPGMGRKNLGVCLAEAAPEAFVGVPKAQLARQLLGWARDSLKTAIVVGSPVFPGCLGWRALRARGTAHPHRGVAETSADDLAAILFTSGSTGVPKGVVYEHGHFLAQIARLRDNCQLGAGEVDLATFPPFALFDPALGMTSVIPWMDPTRPALARPAYLLDAIERHGVTHMFGSPALLNRFSRELTAQGQSLPGLRRVLSAGAPVPWQTLARMQSLLPPEAQIFTPYGATECLPVAWIGSHEILHETQAQTRTGAGVCIGRPVAGAEVIILPISDQVWPSGEALPALPVGELGEITVSGAHVTRRYYQREASTQLAKIEDDRGRLWHRMGDLGYFDATGRLWFCGRKSHRVQTATQTLYTIPCEAVFNTHPAVYRTALVGVGPPGQQQPVICVELEAEMAVPPPQVILDLQTLARQYPHTAEIHHFLIHPGSLPVDIRHNSKIFREKLAPWAAQQLSG